MTNNYNNVILRIFKSYTLEIISHNKRKLKKIKKEDSIKIAFYISPADFNPIISRKLVANKIDLIRDTVNQSGVHTFYLFRENLNSSEAIPVSLFKREGSIVKISLKIHRLVILFIKRKISAHKKKSKLQPNQKAESVLAEHLALCLKKSLIELNPKIIFSIGAKQELLQVTNEIGIPVVEVMHGVIQEEDITSMWCGKYKVKPNLVLTWHRHYTQLLKELDVNAITLGYPSNVVERPKKQPRQEIRVLVTLGHSNSDSSDPYGVFDTKLMSQIQRLSHQNVKFIFRTHPVVDSNNRINKDFAKWLESRFKEGHVHSSHNKSLWDSLNGVDIHISKSSSTFIEAALVGIPTIFTDNLQELRLPTEVIDKGIVLQGGNLDYREIREIAGRDLPDVFEFMNKNELLNQLKRYLNDE
jgi:hypothetical protein